jgi:general secretion pathway protein B
VAELGGGADDVPGAAPSRAAERTAATARSAPPEPSRPARGTSPGAGPAGTGASPQGVPAMPMTGAAGPAVPGAAGAPAALPGAAQTTTPHAAAVPPPAGTAAAPAAAASAAGRIYAANELPEEVRRQIPGLSIGGSVYSESAASRFLIVNGQVRHEGEQAAPEVTLEKIKLRSAVMIFRGYRFELGY